LGKEGSAPHQESIIHKDPVNTRPANTCQFI